jgi:hypothetical protein
MKVTRVIFSTINNKWYIEIEYVTQIQVTEKVAKSLIDQYKLQEYTLFNWASFK